MSRVISKIKQKVKDNDIVYDVIMSYLVKFDYGYMHSRTEIRRFLDSLNKNIHLKEYDSDKEDIFVFIGDKNIDSTMRKAVFGDIDLGNKIDYECHFYTTRILKDTKWKKFHKFFFKVNKCIPLPFKKKWERLYTTEEIELRKDKNMFIIFLAGAYYEETFSQPWLFKKIHEFSEHTFCKKILYMVDPIDKYPHLSEWFPYFDLVASYSHEDERKYGTVYIDSPCVNYNLKQQEIEKDIYFRAMDSGRGELVERCYHFFSERNVVCDFHIQTADKKYVSYPGMVFDNTRVDYPKMLQEENSSNVLLEIVIPGVGSGTTLRYKEAIMYGKKLLTNNPNVRLLDLYDSRYVKYMEKPEDVDVDWIKKREVVDYNYDDEFSTNAFCKKIVALFDNSRGEQ